MPKSNKRTPKYTCISYDMHIGYNVTVITIATGEQFIQYTTLQYTKCWQYKLTHLVN